MHAIPSVGLTSSFDAIAVFEPYGYYDKISFAHYKVLGSQI